MKHLIGMLAAALISLCSLTSVQAAQVPGPHLGNGDVLDLTKTAPGPQDFDIIPDVSGQLKVSLGVLNNVTFTGLTLHDNTVPGFLSRIGSLTDALFSSLVATHDYTLEISYISGGNPSYHGSALLLTTVPLPPSLPLLAAALGVLALVMYRKRKVDAL